MHPYDNIQTDFYEKLQTYGYVFEYSPIFYNFNAYNTKMVNSSYDTIFNFTLKDINISNHIDFIYEKLKNLNKHNDKFIVICHSRGYIFGMEFIKRYMSQILGVFIINWGYSPKWTDAWINSRSKFLRANDETIKNLIDKIYNEGWYQIDEAIMTIVQRENPELFDLYYGDYQGIISNYLEPVNNIDLIMTMINKAYKYNNLTLMFRICKYLIPYFKLNINSNYIYDFIKYNIICNYYCNEKLLLTDIIYLINMKIIEILDNSYNSNINNKINNKIIEILNQNIDNINFYLNKKYIIKNTLITSSLMSIS